MEVDIVIVPEGNEKNKIYSISSIQVPNVVTQGRTIDEAKGRLREALELYSEEIPEEKARISQVNEKSNLPMISRLFL